MPITIRVVARVFVVAFTASCGLSQALTFDFNDGTLQGWTNVSLSRASEGYYDLAFGAAQRAGAANGGVNSQAPEFAPHWSTVGDGLAVPPTGPYFLGEVPMMNYGVNADWDTWPTAGSGAHQTLWVQSPAFALADFGHLTYIGYGASAGVPLASATNVPAIAGTWGEDSGNPAETKGSCSVGLLRDDGVFVLMRDFVREDRWRTYTFTAEQLAPFVGDGHSYTLNMIDFWSGRNAACAIDDVSIPGVRVQPQFRVQSIDVDDTGATARLSWGPTVDGYRANVLTANDLREPRNEWSTLASVGTRTGTMAAEVPCPPPAAFFTVELRDTWPTAPTSLSATYWSANTVVLTWEDHAANETGFTIERKTGAAGDYEVIATVGANVTTYLSAGLSPGVSTTYRVCATHAEGPSDYALEAVVTPPTPPAPLPVIMSQGYTNILDLRISGTPGNWLLSDLCTREPQDGYEWWYVVGSKVVKTATPLANEPWQGNQPGRVLKMGGKLGLDTFNRWDLNAGEGGYHDRNAGMFFEHGDVGGFTTFMFK